MDKTGPALIQGLQDLSYIVKFRAFAEAMRFSSYAKTSLAPLSRAVCGVRASTLFMNFPGSVRGVREKFEAIRKALPHAIATLSEQTARYAS